MKKTTDNTNEHKDISKRRHDVGPSLRVDDDTNKDKEGGSVTNPPPIRKDNRQEKKSNNDEDLEMACNHRQQRQRRLCMFEEEEEEDTSESDDEDRYPGAVRVAGVNNINSNIDGSVDLLSTAESTAASTRTPVIISAHVVDEDVENAERDQLRRNMERMERLEEEVRRLQERERNTTIAIATATPSSAPVVEEGEEIGQIQGRSTEETTNGPVVNQERKRQKEEVDDESQHLVGGIIWSKYAITLVLCAIIIIIAVTVPLVIQGGENKREIPDIIHSTDGTSSTEHPIAAPTPTQISSPPDAASPPPTENRSDFARPSLEECDAIATRDAPRENGTLVAYSFIAAVDVYTFVISIQDFNQRLLESLQMEVAPLLAGCEETPGQRRNLQDGDQEEVRSKIVNVEFENLSDRVKSCRGNAISRICLTVDFTAFVDGDKEVEASHLEASFQYGITNLDVDGVTRIELVDLDVSPEAPMPTTTVPSVSQSRNPSVMPSTSMPSASPSNKHSVMPGNPTMMPTTATPSDTPTTSNPSLSPSDSPTSRPSVQPSSFPSSLPSRAPTSLPSSSPSIHPSLIPTTQPSQDPTMHSTVMPSSQPSESPSRTPTSAPTCTRIEDFFDSRVIEDQEEGGGAFARYSFQVTCGGETDLVVMAVKDDGDSCTNRCVGFVSEEDFETHCGDDDGEFTVEFLLQGAFGDSTIYIGYRAIDAPIVGGCSEGNFDFPTPSPTMYVPTRGASI